MKFSPLFMPFLAAELFYAPAANAAPSIESASSSISISKAVNGEAISFIITAEAMG